MNAWHGGVPVVSQPLRLCMQMSVIAAGSVALAGVAFARVGGFPGLVRQYPSASICGAPHNPWKMLRAADDEYMPGWVFTLTCIHIMALLASLVTEQHLVCRSGLHLRTDPVVVMVPLL
jgi:hypothetical protein